jgi:hypothetical protein
MISIPVDRDFSRNQKTQGLSLSAIATLAGKVTFAPALHVNS